MIFYIKDADTGLYWCGTQHRPFRPFDEKNDFDDFVVKSFYVYGNAVMKALRIKRQNEHTNLRIVRFDYDDFGGYAMELGEKEHFIERWYLNTKDAYDSTFEVARAFIQMHFEDYKSIRYALEFTSNDAFYSVDETMRSLLEEAGFYGSIAFVDNGIWFVKDEQDIMAFRMITGTTDFKIHDLQAFA